MVKRLTLEDFITRSKQVYGDKYLNYWWEKLLYKKYSDDRKII